MSRKSDDNRVADVIIFLLLPIAIVVNGLLLKAMWGWFMVPLGLRPVGVAHALGISLLVGMLTGPHPSEESSVKMLISMFLKPIFYLILSATFYAFM